MGIFGPKTWASEAKGPGGLFHQEKKCPPVKDCDVKNYVISREQTPPETRQEKQQERSGVWPYAGSYSPFNSRQTTDEDE